MIKLLRLLIILAVLPISTFAQSNYKPGYVVNLKGDTIHGYVNYREWNNAPRQFSFKNQPEDANATEFNNQNARAFGVTGLVHYERHTVSISIDPLNIDALKMRPDLTTITDTVFLKILTRGTHITLYAYTDDIKPRFYISQTGGNAEPEELSYHLYTDPDQPDKLKYINRYRTQLLYEAQNAGVANNKLESTIAVAAYNDDDLIKVVSKINGGADKRYEVQNESGSRWFAGIGLKHYSLYYTGATPLAGAPASNGISPLIDVGIDFFPFKEVQRFYFRLEGGASYDRYSFYHRDPLSTPIGARVSLNVKQLNLIMTPQLVYNVYNQSNLKIFIDGGVGVNLSFTGNHQQRITFDDTDISAQIQNKYPYFYGLWMTFPVKAGVAIGKKIELYAIYTPSKIISDGDFALFSGIVGSYGIGLNYYLGK